jgi:glutamate/tyrosine decarboxylase-like PLP-dependent enzyme
VKIPAVGRSADDVFAELETFRGGDVPWREGRTLAYVYHPGAEAEAVVKRAFTMYLTENALDPTSFPSTLRLENDVVSMAASHLGGDEHTAGNFTSGGTESLILAMKTARDFARARRDIRDPEVVLPSTAHASFQKAAHYLAMKAVIVPVDPVSFKADVVAMRAAITPRTVLLVGSAPSYAHGVIDPITELGALAQEHGLLLHVDACIGGFLLPYFRRLGMTVPPFDLQVPGVTSISMDFHKYGFAAKGASVILYKSRDLRRFQLYACATWPGYTVVNPTVQSSKSAGPIAACWALMNFLGDAGYLAMSARMLEGTRKIVAGIAETPGLRLLGKPEMNLIAFTSDEASVFHIADEMRRRGWYVQPQLAYGSSKENLHLSINLESDKLAEPFLAALRESLAVARTLPPGPLAAQLGGMLGAMDLSKLGPEMAGQMLALAGIKVGEGGGLPENMAEVNEVMNTLPPELRQLLLVEYVNELFRVKLGDA